MPRNPIDYSKMIIYKICCKDTCITDIYVGLTTDLRSRKNSHKCLCNQGKNIYVYNFIRETGGWDNWEVVPIEIYSCENRLQAEIRERYWLEQLGATLNKNIPTRDIKELRNTETYKEYQKQYKIKNKERIKEMDKNSLKRRREEKKKKK